MKVNQPGVKSVSKILKNIFVRSGAFAIATFVLGGLAHPLGPFPTEGCPSIRAKALSRTKISFAVPSTAFFAREVEDQDSGNLTLNHISVWKIVSTNHRFGPAHRP